MGDPEFVNSSSNSLCILPLSQAFSTYTEIWFPYVLHQYIQDKMLSLQTEYEQLSNLRKTEKSNHLRDVENLNLEVENTNFSTNFPVIFKHSSKILFLNKIRYAFSESVHLLHLSDYFFAWLFSYLSSKVNILYYFISENKLLSSRILSHQKLLHEYLSKSNKTSSSNDYSSTVSVKISLVFVFFE